MMIEKQEDLQREKGKKDEEDEADKRRNQEGRLRGWCVVVGYYEGLYTSSVNAGGEEEEIIVYINRVLMINTRKKSIS